MAGWGSITTEYGKSHEYPDKLNEVALPLWDTKTCRSNWLNIAEDGNVDEDMNICAVQDGKDSCSVSKLAIFLNRTEDPLVSDTGIGYK